MNYWRKILISLLLVNNINSLLATPQSLDKVIAIVNDDIILQSELNTILSIIKINIENTGQQITDENALRYQILDRLIIDKIIMQIAKKTQIQIPDQTIDITINHIATQNGLTLDQLQQQLSTAGIDYQHYRNDIRREIIITKVRDNEVIKRVTILPEEVDSLATQLNLQTKQHTNVNLSHILIPLPKNPTKKQNQLAMTMVKKIIIQLKQGVDFNKLAITYSTDHNNVLQGGLVGWNKIEKLPTIFVEKIKYAKKGDIIGPIRSNIGLHIIKLNDIQQSNILPILVTEVKTRHIFIKLSPSINNKQAYIKIQQIAQQIKTGQITFSEAAKKYSQDYNYTLHDTELNWNTLNVYDPIFHDILMKLNKGEISKPIHSPFGWYLIQLEDIRLIDKSDVTQKNQTYELLFNRKFYEEAQIWIQELRASSYIKIFDDTYDNFYEKNN